MTLKNFNTSRLNRMVRTLIDKADGITVHFRYGDQLCIADIALPDVDMSSVEVLLSDEHLTVHGVQKDSRGIINFVKHVVRLPRKILKFLSWAEYSDSSMRVLMPLPT